MIYPNENVDIKFIATSHLSKRGRGARDRMVVGFTTIYAINAYHH